MTNPPPCRQCPSVFDPYWRHAVPALAVQWSGSVTPVVVYLLLILDQSRTQSIAFRHPPRNSARIITLPKGYVTIYFTASVHRRCQRIPNVLGTNKTVEET